MWIDNIAIKIAQAITLPKMSGEAPKSPLADGQIVQGKVIKLLPNAQLLVNVEGQKMVASSKSPMAEGQTFVGKLQNVGQKMTINILPGKNAGDIKTTEMLRALLPGKEPMGQSLSKVLDLPQKEGLPSAIKQTVTDLAGNIQKTIAGNIENNTPAKTKSAIRNSGLFMEATLKEAVVKNMDRTTVGKILQTDVKAMLGTALTEITTETERVANRLKALVPLSTSAEKEIMATQRETKSTVPLTTESGKEPVIAEKAARAGAANSAKGAAPHGQAALIESTLADLARMREAGKNIRDAINNIELNQVMNSTVDRKQGDGAPPSFYQLPFFEGNLVNNARVFINPRREGDASSEGKGSDESRMVFMLNMSKLGPVRVDVRVNKEKVTGSIFAVNDSATSYMKNELPKLVSPLTSAGYKVWFDVATAGAGYVTEELENAIPLRNAPQGLINVKA